MVHRHLTACVMGGLVCRQPAADAPQRLADRPTEQGRKFILERQRSGIEAAKAKGPGDIAEALSVSRMSVWRALSQAARPG
jgi:hypothetical protein